tara:strand:- start:252 stop:449 length:198 start_codon:yes stop_codon:yes gene_type:complete
MSKTLNTTKISVGAFCNKHPIELELKEVSTNDLMNPRYRIVIVPKDTKSFKNLSEFFNALKEDLK